MKNIYEILKSSQIELIVSIIGVLASAIVGYLTFKREKNNLKITILDGSNNKIEQTVSSQQDLKEWVKLGSMQIEELGKVVSNEKWAIDHTKNDKIKILLFSALPLDISKFQVESEVKAISKHLENSFAKDKFEITYVFSATPSIFYELISQKKPSIVHFFVGEIGQSQNNKEMTNELSFIGFIEIIESFSDVIKVVIVSTEFPIIFVEKLKGKIPFIIGMKQSIGNKAAIAFSEGFYKAIGGGKDFKSAFEFGKLMMNLEDENLNQSITLIDKYGLEI